MMMLNFDFVLRLLVAGILGAIIGLDREYRAKEAGYRTHFLDSSVRVPSFSRNR